MERYHSTSFYWWNILCISNKVVFSEIDNKTSFQILLLLGCICEADVQFYGELYQLTF